MANKLLSKTYNGGVNYTNALDDATVYTVPLSNTTIMIGFTISNLHNDLISVSVKLKDDDAGQTVHYLKDVVINVGSSLEIMQGNKMVLNANDEVIISSTIANSFDAVLSLVEQT
jgi:hypothetical protein